MIQRRHLLGVGASLPLLATTRVLAQSPFRDTTAARPVGSAYSIMLADPRLTSWMRLIRASGLDSFADGRHIFTAFPLSDAAFDSAPELARSMLGTEQGFHGLLPGAFPDTSPLVHLVRLHVAQGKLLPQSVAGREMKLASLAGPPIAIDATRRPMRVTWQSVLDGHSRVAEVADQPLVCANAVVYILGQIARV